MDGRRDSGSQRREEPVESAAHAVCEGCLRGVGVRRGKHGVRRILLVRPGGLSWAAASYALGLR